MLSNTYSVRENMVLELTERRLERTGRGVSRTALYEKGLGNLPRFVLSLISGWIFKRFTCRFTDDAIWFSGVARDINQRGHELSDEDLERFSSELEPDLQGLKVNLREIREGLLSLHIREVQDKKLFAQRAALLAGLSDVFESIEALHWAIQEEKANRAKQLDGFQAGSLAELDTLFRKLEEHA